MTPQQRLTADAHFAGIKAVLDEAHYREARKRASMRQPIAVKVSQKVRSKFHKNRPQKIGPDTRGKAKALAVRVLNGEFPKKWTMETICDHYRKESGLNLQSTTVRAAIATIKRGSGGIR